METPLHLAAPARVYSQAVPVLVLPLTTPQTVTSEGDHQCPGGHPSLIHSTTLRCLPDIEDSTWPSVHGDVCVAITWTPKALSEWCAGRCGGADRYLTLALLRRDRSKRWAVRFAPEPETLLSLCP